MAKIIYFGANGCSGHYPIGIDMALTGEEYNNGASVIMKSG